MVKSPSAVRKDWENYTREFMLRAKTKGLSLEEVQLCLAYAEPLFCSGLPIIFSPDHLFKLVGYTANYVMGASQSPKNFYRCFEIKKKNGGMRQITEPLPSLKEIQRWILDHVVVKGQISPAAKAFRSGHSIKDNARFHRRQPLVLTVDIKDFFPSINEARVYSAFRKFGYCRSVTTLLTSLCCFEGSLPQGAPTSAALSNLILLPLDNQFFGFARSQGIRYTRYADDITFSGCFSPPDLVHYIYRSLNAYGFRPNISKTRLLRAHQQQQVTGIVVNDKLQVPRDLRRKLRQDAHYIEKYGIEHHAVKKRVENANYADYLYGQASFVLSINGEDRDAIALREALKPKNVPNREAS